MKSIACVQLDHGATITNPAISQDGRRHYHDTYLQDHIPKTWLCAVTKTATFRRFRSTTTTVCGSMALHLKAGLGGVQGRGSQFPDAGEE